MKTSRYSAASLQALDAVEGSGGDRQPSYLERVAGELTALGVTISARPGEYRINYRTGSDDTARYTDDLDEALALGRELAAARLATDAVHGSMVPRRRPKRMTSKAIRRRMIKRHNHRLRARALAAQTDPSSSDD
jgi:hypothetical protein